MSAGRPSRRQNPGGARARRPPTGAVRGDRPLSDPRSALRLMASPVRLVSVGESVVSMSAGVGLRTDMTFDQDRRAGGDALRHRRRRHRVLVFRQFTRWLESGAVTEVDIRDLVS